MGLIKPQQGNIALCGLPINRALKQNLVAYVPQAEEVDWQFPVSVYDVVMMGRYGYMNFLRIPKAEDKQKVLEAMQRVNIEHLAERQIGELSGGQKRVFLARALAQQSKIILLDEPFTGVMLKCYFCPMSVHLYPVTNPRKASQFWQKVVDEMENHCELFSKVGAGTLLALMPRLREYNAQSETESALPLDRGHCRELADLMMVASKEAEDAILPSWTKGAQQGSIDDPWQTQRAIKSDVISQV